MLTKNRVFAALPSHLRERLLAAATVRTYAAGATILSEGDAADRVFCLEEGTVRVFHASPEGLEVLLKLFRAPAIFGEAEALSGGQYVENVHAVDAAKLVELPVSVLLEVLREDATAACALLVDVAARLAITAQHEKSLAFDPITVRLANYLVDYVSWFGGETRAIALTQDQMAAAIGATRRSVGKDITSWQADGILVRNGDTYVVNDLPALQRYADGDRPKLHYTLERRSRPR